MSKAIPYGGFFAKTPEGENLTEFWEFRGHSENWVENAGSMTRILGCSYNERLIFRDDMIGSNYILGNQLFRNLPQVHSEVEDMFVDSMRLVDCRGWESLDATNQAMTFNVSGIESDGSDGLIRKRDEQGLAVYEVAYRGFLYDLLTDDEIATIKDGLFYGDTDDVPDPVNGIFALEDSGSGQAEMRRFVEVNTQPSAENLPLPNRHLYFLNEAGTGFQLDTTGGEYPLNQAAPYLFPKQVFTLEWKNVPLYGVPLVQMEGMLGKVNKFNFDVYWPQGKRYRFLPETVILLAGIPKTKRSANGQVYSDITYTFEYRTNTHNKFLYWPTGQFRKVGWTKNVTPASTDFRSLYESADYYRLFMVDTTTTT